MFQTSQSKQINQVVTFASTAQQTLQLIVDNMLARHLECVVSQVLLKDLWALVARKTIESPNDFITNNDNN